MSDNNYAMDIDDMDDMDESTLSDIDKMILNYNPAPPKEWVDPHSIEVRKFVWRETIRRYKELNVSDKLTQKYTYVPTLDDFNKLKVYLKTDVCVINQDSLYAAEDLIYANYNPIVLNMADWCYAGGCVTSGAKTQEEELFRRSNYHKHLLQSFYPLKSYDIMVSYNIEVYREGPDKDYEIKKIPFRCNMIASPALNSPSLIYLSDKLAVLKDQDIVIMKNKMRQLIYFATKSGSDSIVLSAWGCGAFNLPPTQIAQLFKEVLGETDGCLRKIVFAITNHKNNYDIFKKVFDTSSII